MNNFNFDTSKRPSFPLPNFPKPDFSLPSVPKFERPYVLPAGPADKPSTWAPVQYFNNQEEVRDNQLTLDRSFIDRVSRNYFNPKMPEIQPPAVDLSSLLVNRFGPEMGSPSRPIFTVYDHFKLFHQGPPLWDTSGPLGKASIAFDRVLPKGSQMDMSAQYLSAFSGKQSQRLLLSEPHFPAQASDSRESFMKELFPKKKPAYKLDDLRFELINSKQKVQPIRDLFQEFYRQSPQSIQLGHAEAIFPEFTGSQWKVLSEHWAKSYPMITLPELLAKLQSARSTQGPSQKLAIKDRVMPLNKSFSQLTVFGKIKRCVDTLDQLPTVVDFYKVCSAAVKKPVLTLTGEVHSLLAEFRLAPNFTEKSRRIDLPGYTKWNHQIGLINGMNVIKKEFVGNLKYLQKLSGGHAIQGVYNQTHGVVGDLLEIAGLNFFGYSPNTAKLVKHNWTAFYMNTIHNPEARYLQFCHSQGAIDVKNALDSCPPEISAKVIVIVIAGAASITDQMCAYAEKYASKKDFVPLMEMVFGWALNAEAAIDKAQENYKGLQRLEAHADQSGIGHGFKDPVFHEKIGEILKHYLDKK